MITPASKYYKGYRKEWPKNYKRRGMGKLLKQHGDREKDRRKRQIERGQLRIENGLVI